MYKRQGFIRKDDQEALMEMFRQHKRQRKIAAAADKTGNGYLLEMFRYELANHEYGYTRDPEPVSYTPLDVYKRQLLRILGELLRQC